MKKGLIGLIFILSIHLHASILNKCNACHGVDFRTKALGLSKIVQDMTKEEIMVALKGYKNGTYGRTMSALMEGQLSEYSDSEIEKIANEIKKLEDNKSVSVKSIAICASKDSDASRLICYDSLAHSIGVDEPKIKRTSKGKWLVSESRSPIDDSITVTLMLDSANTIRTPYQTNISPIMVLRCSENTTNAYVNWDMFLGMDSTRVLTRMDKEKAKTRSWSLSTDNKAIFAPKNIAFIKSMFGHEQILIQLTPYSESPKMATFDIGGLEEAIKPLRKACGW